MNALCVEIARVGEANEANDFEFLIGLQLARLSASGCSPTRKRSRSPSSTRRTNRTSLRWPCHRMDLSSSQVNPVKNLSSWLNFYKNMKNPFAENWPLTKVFFRADVRMLVPDNERVWLYKFLDTQVGMMATSLYGDRRRYLAWSNGIIAMPPSPPWPSIPPPTSRPQQRTAPSPPVTWTPAKCSTRRRQVNIPGKNRRSSLNLNI